MRDRHRTSPSARDGTPNNSMQLTALRAAADAGRLVSRVTHERHYWSPKKEPGLGGPGSRTCSASFSFLTNRRNLENCKVSGVPIKGVLLKSRGDKLVTWFDNYEKPEGPESLKAL